ncbi:MAG: glutamine-hydrolyzing carbamoyl-phosphate synthase small subunit [Verrucomicrobiota bacterium]
MKGLLALEDGTVLRGMSFGAHGTVTAEVCFNTSMTGYQEILTDPSYKGQMVALTYPEIGNYGINEEDVESHQPHVSALIVRELSPIASNWRSQETLDEYLKRYNIPALSKIDTRALTKRLRVAGAMKGLLTTEDMSDEAAVTMAREWRGLEGVDYVKEVTCSQSYNWDTKDLLSKKWFDRHELGKNPRLNELPPIQHRIVAFDFGIKYNILRHLRRCGFDVTVVPATATANEVLKENPDGIFLSNGPGDPAAVTYAHETLRGLIGKKPIFGICFGHQVLGHAMGGRTFKLKFGHRGGNQPVKDLRTGKVTITAQNHGFAVDAESLPKENVEVTHINLNDGTCEGLQHRKYPVFSVQYHPEAAPGPHDAHYFFNQFRELVEQHKQS